MTGVLDATGLGKRYGHKWALSECTVSVPAGKVVGLVGPNGAGKSTLLQLSVGLLRADAGSITVLGGRPGSTSGQLARVGFVAQDTPTYAAMSIRDHLRFGAWTNPAWDAALADDRIEQLGLDPSQKAGKLSGGQRAQLALTLAVAKHPDLLVLDEPVASLDPLARREFLQALTEVVVEHGTSVILSSHLVADIARVCDHLVVLVDSRVRVAGDIGELLATHHRLTGLHIDRGDLPPGQRVVGEHHAARQSTFVVRSDEPIVDPPWSTEPLDLEDLVLAYMTRAADDGRRPPLEVRP